MSTATTTLTPSDFVDALANWTVLDVIEAVKLMEERLGIVAQQATTAVQTVQTDADQPAEVTQTEFSVSLISAGPSKVPVIKVIREVTGVTLMEAKAIADTVPSVIKEGLSKEEADSLAAKVMAQGAEVEIK